MHERSNLRSEVALNNIHLSRIEMLIGFADTNSAANQIDLAIDNLDQAWSDMPKSAREKVRQPSIQLEEILDARVVSDERMLRWKAYRRISSRQRERIRQEQEIDIGKEMILRIKTQIYDALEDGGYLLSGIKPKVGSDGWPKKTVIK